MATKPIFTAALATLAVSAALAAAETTPAKPAAGAKSAPVASKAYKQMPPSFNIPLWQESPVPGAKGDGPLDKPFLTVFQPAEGHRNGGSIIVAPGGSNIMLMYGAEGIDIAERYNSWGVTAFVLTYRMSPAYNQQARIQDGQRAIQIVRARAAEWKLDTSKIGFIGFSAGSNFITQMTVNSLPGDPAAKDPIERVSSRPDYIGLVYGPGTIPTDAQMKTMPPTFMLSAEGDSGPAVGNANLFAAMARNKVPGAEIHVYQNGHHGFGDGYASQEFSDWMGRLELFLKVGGFIPGHKEPGAE